MDEAPVGRASADLREPDPVAFFQEFAREELRRASQTDPEFDPLVYSRAVALVLERLQALGPVRGTP
ncbi:MAG: hypothetical protein H7831_17290 [Magnetococcus sp. WYHC-3]